jgi:hypothetical protein
VITNPSVITIKWGQIKPSQPPPRVGKVAPNQTVTTRRKPRPDGATSNRHSGANSGCHGQQLSTVEATLVVEFGGHGVEFGFAVDPQIGALGKVLA